jgi:hypothetical protein
MSALLTKQHRAAQKKMATAKQRFSAAAVAVLRGDPDADTLARIALDLVQEARAELRRLRDIEART